MVGKRSSWEGRGDRPRKKGGLRGQSSYAQYCRALPADVAATFALPPDKDAAMVLSEAFKSGRYRSRDNSALVDRTLKKVVTVRSWRKDWLPAVTKGGDKRTRAKLLGLKKGFGSQAWRRKQGLDVLKGVNYSTVEELNGLWGKYAESVLTMYRKPEEAIFEMDMHGARVSVEHARNPRFVGLTGLVLKDQPECFELIFPDGHRMVVSKRGTEFSMVVGKHKVVVNGSRLLDVKKGINGNVKFHVEGVTCPS